MIDIATALASLKAARDVAANYSDLPLKSALLDAYEQMLAVREEALVVQEELHKARRRILELEDQLTAKLEDPRVGLTFDRGVWWASDSRAHSELGPFCPTCLDATDKRRLLARNGATNAYASCRHCKGNFEAWPEDREPPPPPAHSDWLRRRPY